MESIKRLFTASFLVFGFALHAANPAYESFKGTNGQVVTTPGIGAARVVIISGQNFQPGSTNLTNWSNLPTNALSFSQIWTNDNGTVYLVPANVFEVFTTNLNNEGLLSSLGPLSFGSTSQILSLGTNDVDTSIVSDRVMTSPTNNAALVTLRLTPPTFGAQLLFISNGDTNTAWTIVDGQTNTTGGGAANLQGDFVANAPGVGLILKADGNDWVEMGRFNPEGLAPAAINPTVNFLPYNSNGVAFGDSAFVQRGVTPYVTNQTQIEAALLWFQNTNQTLTIGINGPNTSFLTASKELSLFGTNGVGITSPGNFHITLTTQNTNQFVFSEKRFAPGLSNLFSLGTPELPWKDLYLGTNSFFLGTNIYTDNGADLLRNGEAVGGSGGGTSIWATASGRYSPTDVNAQSLQFGSNAVAGAIHSIVLGSGSTNGPGARSSTISGGTNNWILTNAVATTISGGADNQIGGSVFGATIGGGVSHLIDGGVANYATIAGGFDSRVFEQYGTIGGGQANLAESIGSTIGGGVNNRATRGDYTTVSGGEQNIARGDWAFLGGGTLNTISANASGSDGLASALVGGTRNLIGSGGTAGANYSFLGGGRSNLVMDASDYGVLGGGSLNQIGGGGNQVFGNVIVGGFNNLTDDQIDFSVIGGGVKNRIGADWGAILGGVSNNVTATYAIAIGNFLTNATTKSVEIGPDNINKVRSAVGVFQPATSNTVDLGTPTAPFKSLYLQTNSFYLGTNVYSDGGASLLRNGVAVGAGGAGASATNVFASLRAFVDPVYGNDSTAVIGDVTKPYETITNAVTAANVIGANGTNVVVILAPHTNYILGANQVLYLTNNVSLRGSGRYASVIVGDGTGNTNAPLVQVRSNGSVEDLTIRDTNSTIGVRSSNSGFTNVVIRNVFLDGGKDNIYISTTNEVEMSFYDCEIRGMWDGGITVGDAAYPHILSFFNCEITVDQRNDYGATGAAAHGFVADNGTNNFYGGSITVVATNTAQHALIQVRGANAVINLAGGTRFIADFPTSVNPYIIYNTGGGKVFSDAPLELNRINGAVIFLNTNAFLRSVTSSGLLNLLASNYVTIATGGSVGGLRITNALPEIQLIYTNTDAAFSPFRIRPGEIEMVNTALSLNWHIGGMIYVEVPPMASMTTNVAFKVKSHSANGPFDILNVLTNGTILTASSNVSDIGTALLPYRTNYAKAFTVVGSTKTVAYAENGLVHLDADRFRLAGANPITTNLTIAGLATLHITNGLIMSVSGP